MVHLNSSQFYVITIQQTIQSIIEEKSALNSQYESIKVDTEVFHCICITLF